MKWLRLLLVSTLVSAATGDDRKPPSAGDGPLVIDSALVTLIEEIQVPARVEGVLLSVEAREGKLVGPGDLLGRIDDAEPRLTLERAGVELEIARKQARSDLKTQTAKKAAEIARVELKRGREAEAKYKNSVSPTELDRLQLAVEKADLEVLQTVHDRELAELSVGLKEAERSLAAQAVERRRIVSPLAGIVVQVNQHAGEWVEPGKTVLRILRMDLLRVEAFVLAKQLTGEVTGQPAVLTVDLPGQPASEFAGKVSFVSPEVNPVNGQVRLWVEIPNPELRLRPGLKGRLTVGAPAASAK